MLWIGKAHLGQIGPDFQQLAALTKIYILDSLPWAQEDRHIGQESALSRYLRGIRADAPPRVLDDERVAREFIEAQRWSGRPSCPRCSATDRIQKRVVEAFYRCLSCKLDFTVRTGTLFERSHVPLHKWLLAIDLVAEARGRYSSAMLSRVLDVTQKTAWLMLQRIRFARGDSIDGWQTIFARCLSTSVSRSAPKSPAAQP